MPDEILTKTWVKPYTIALTHNSANGNFYVDFWDPITKNYVVSVQIDPLVAIKISDELRIKIEC